VKVGSHKWDVLVLAAGGAAQVPGYCKDLVDGDQSDQGGGQDNQGGGQNNQGGGKH
jgi:hypothetical protein